MKEEIVRTLIQTAGGSGVVLGALWLFRDHIYFSFGRPPAPEERTPTRRSPPTRRGGPRR